MLKTDGVKTNHQGLAPDYQLEHAQDKLVSVVRGKVFDVAVDVRSESPTFGKWVGEILSDDNQHQMFVPKGVAHGFCILRNETDLFYKCSDFPLFLPDWKC